MKIVVYGLLLYIFLLLPPVANLLESIMILHMHMQMPLLVISGCLMFRFFKGKMPLLFTNWNSNGLPGIILFIIIWSYWMLPRNMDLVLTNSVAEWFKFISLPFLAGVPLCDSWAKLSTTAKRLLYIYFIVLFMAMAWIYILLDEQICNNYLVVQQQTVGWVSMIFAVFMIIFGIQFIVNDQSEFQT